MARTLEAHPAGAVDLLALGPLTNVARLVTDHASAARRLGRLIAMGGALDEPGNVGNGAEFNLAADPEAADIVFGADLPLTLIPLDVTRRVRAGRGDLARLSRGDARARTAAALIEAYFQSTTGGESRPLHDPCVMHCALDPGLFGIERRAVAPDLSRGADAGRLGPGPHRVDVAMTVDAPSVLERLLRGLGAP
jgi:purine nucleosidase/pyrimidine-specific ribonucleoside hydrolase